MPRSTFTPAYAATLEVLITLRKNSGVSQVELATRLGKDQPFVSNIERGIRRIDIIEFYAIVQALGGDPGTSFDQIVRKLPKKVVI